MQTKDSPLMKVVVALVAILIILSTMNLLYRPEQEMPEVVVDVPSTDEIALAVEAILSDKLDFNRTVDVDLGPVEEKILATEKAMSDIYERIFEVEYNNLKDDAISATEDEFSEKKLKDFLMLEIDNFDRLRSYSLDEDFGDDGIKVTVINLGLDDKEDSEVIVESMFDIRYELGDTNTRYKAQVLVTSVVTYDEDEGFESELSFEIV
jgi:hypothetical protein